MNGVVENKGGKRKHGPRGGTVNHSELNIMDVQMNQRKREGTAERRKTSEKRLSQNTYMNRFI